jgi:hypothetical protein
MDDVLTAGGFLLFLVLFPLLLASLRQAQDNNNRNSNPNQSSYVDSPPGGAG